jgi:hypothetical protein
MDDGTLLLLPRVFIDVPGTAGLRQRFDPADGVRAGHRGITRRLIRAAGKMAG